jgi:segregation and condensation protein B
MDERTDPEEKVPENTEREEAQKEDLMEELPPHLLIEASLFSAGKPVSMDDISESTGIEPALVKLYLKKLMSSYSRRDTSLEIIKAGRKYSLRVREPYVERISALAAPEVNPKLLKTAALIAYHQPMRQSELVEMYGSKIYDHVKELITLGLVRGRREGSTKVLTTTHRFSETFGISSVSKKKVKSHVKDRVLEKISRVTLERYDLDEDPEDESQEDEDGDRQE